MIDIITIVISLLAFGVSIYTAWRTLIQKGNMKITRPTVIYFGHDNGINSIPKIFFRALLYCTAKSGLIIENMYVKVKRGESIQNFNVWVYGDDELFRGSGLFIGENGVICNHQFLLPRDGARFDFISGEYILEVYAKIAGKDKSQLLLRESLFLSEALSRTMNKDKVGVYFDWGEDSGKYNAHAEKKRKPSITTNLG